MSRVLEIKTIDHVCVMGDEKAAWFRTLDMVRKFMQREKAADALFPAGPGCIARGPDIAVGLGAASAR